MSHPNEQVKARHRANLSRATVATKALIEQGHTVQVVHFERHCPRIEIQYTPRCARFNGSWSIYKRRGDAVLVHMVAEFLGCLVEWDEPLRSGYLSRPFEGGESWATS